jgi:hypothetical protein
MIRPEVPAVSVRNAPIGENPDETDATVEIINVGLDVGGGEPVSGNTGVRLQFGKQSPQRDALVVAINLPPHRHYDGILEEHIHPVEKDALGIGESFVFVNHILELPKQVVLDVGVSDIVMDGLDPFRGFFTRHCCRAGRHGGDPSEKGIRRMPRCGSNRDCHVEDGRLCKESARGPITVTVPKKRTVYKIVYSRKSLRIRSSGSD